MGSVGKTIWHHAESAGGTIVNAGGNAAKAGLKQAANKIVSGAGSSDEPEEFAMPNGLHRMYHTAHITLNGEEHTLTLITNAQGQAVNTIVVAGKTIVTAGEQIFP
jgi:hypothetical protein